MNLLSKLKEYKYLVAVLIIGYILGVNSKPAKVTSTSESEKKYIEQIASLESKVSELNEQIKKSEETKKFASKEKKFYKDGTIKSEKEVLNESSVTLEEELRESKELVSSYQNTIKELQEKLLTKVVEQNHQRAFFFGPGIKNDGKLSGEIDAIFGNISGSHQNDFKGQWSSHLKFGFYY